MDIMNNIEDFIREMKKQQNKLGFGISHEQFAVLCNKYNKNLVNYIFPSFSSIDEKQSFYCKENNALEQMQKDWNYIFNYLKKTSEEISYMNISLEKYYSHIALEFQEYHHFTKEDILFTYFNSTQV